MFHLLFAIFFVKSLCFIIKFIFKACMYQDYVYFDDFSGEGIVDIDCFVHDCVARWINKVWICCMCIVYEKNRVFCMYFLSIHVSYNHFIYFSRFMMNTCKLIILTCFLKFDMCWWWSNMKLTHVWTCRKYINLLYSLIINLIKIYHGHV